MPLLHSSDPVRSPVLARRRCCRLLPDWLAGGGGGGVGGAGCLPPRLSRAGEGRRPRNREWAFRAPDTCARDLGLFARYLALEVLELSDSVAGTGIAARVRAARGPEATAYLIDLEPNGARSNLHTIRVKPYFQGTYDAIVCSSTSYRVRPYIQCIACQNFQDISVLHSQIESILTCLPASAKARTS